MRKNALAVLVLCSAATGALAEIPEPKCDAAKLLVVPFTGNARNPSQAHLSLGLAAVLAERFEQAPCLESINGPFLLTSEQAGLLDANGESIDLVAAGKLAASKGATMLVGGSFGGRVENWTLTVDVYVVDVVEPKLIGSATVTGPIYEKGLSSKAVHALLARAASDAFNAAGSPLPAETVSALARPSTDDGYAFLLLNRAYGRHFADARGDDSALAVSEYAVRVDPKYVEAQRFYAYLLVESGRPKKARIHYEAVLAMRPRDIRSLVALGMIEIEHKNLQVAETYLERAVDAKPEDPKTHFWLARARLRMGNAPGAIAEFETARSLDPDDIEARRELVALYSADRRYDQAAGELRAMVGTEPDNADFVFQLAACLRAGGRIREAADAYRDAAPRFPKESRFERFREDLLDPKPDGVTELVTSVSNGKALMDEMEGNRQNFQIASNDSVIRLSLERKEGCEKSRSSASLAKKTGADYAELGRRLASISSFTAKAFERGDGAALAPDEQLVARNVTAYSRRAGQDLREMMSLYRGSVVPLLARFGCGQPDADHAASLSDVLARNRQRTVKLEPAKPSAGGGVISPEVPPDPARIIRFTLRNDTDIEYVITLDGDAAHATAIPPGKSITLTARVGRHTLCAIPKGGSCDERSLRTVPLYDRWAMTIKSAD